MSDASRSIDEKIGEVRTDAFDLSFGEIVNLHRERELIIQPEYQRLFRWSNAQRSRLIESILLDLPIPQIFVIENEDGVLELIDGLQRVSSVIQFINPSSLDLQPLTLIGCDLIKELDTHSFETLPLSLRLRIKRSSVRTVVIKRQSKSFLRYEMFKRLNTGGSALSPQEIRNCSSRMAGSAGDLFYGFLQNLANYDSFRNTIETLPVTAMDQRGDEELVLRYFAAKNGISYYKGNIQDWLDSFMEGILFGSIAFDYANEAEYFKEIFSFIDRVIGRGAFVKYRGESPIGALAPAYFEAVSIAVSRSFNQIKMKESSVLRRAISATVQTEEFRSFTGPGANSKEKLFGRIATIETALLAAQE